jgi:phospholipid/cholesterol/gamma-HCH transport system ATP-binding protein
MEAVVGGASERLKRTILGVQDFTLLSYRAFRNLLSPPRYWQDTFDMMDVIGVGSVTIVCLTGLFTGMVLTVQSSATLDAFGARPYVGRMVSLSMIRELGPVLTSLMVAGRVGSGMAAELGSMVVTQQIDAMRALGTDPIRKLVTPRMVAGVVMVPILTILSDAVGMLGGFLHAPTGHAVLLALGGGRHPDARHRYGIGQTPRLRLHRSGGWMLPRAFHARRHTRSGRFYDSLGGHGIGVDSSRGLFSQHTYSAFRLPVIPTAPLISFRNVYYAYPEAEEYALEDITFELPAGGTEIILGGSGSGKSTILKLILGLIKPESGTIEIDGVEISHMKERDLMAIRSKIGMVFQEGALFDSLTVAENVGFRLRDYEHVSEEEFQDRVRAMLGFVGLGEFYDRMPSELSGGQRRRVAVARAMAHRPELILYDEATTGLDPITASTICDLIVKLRDLEGVTTVLVTHQLRDAFQVAQGFVFMRNGKIVYNRIEDLNSLMGTEFIVLNEGEAVFRGRQKELWETPDAYVRKFLS